MVEPVKRGQAVSDRTLAPDLTSTGIQSPDGFLHKKAARRRPLHSNLMISDQAAINAGFDFRRQQEVKPRGYRKSSNRLGKGEPAMPSTRS